MNTLLDKSKYVSAVFYFLEKLKSIKGKKKFFKLFYFLDFDYFERYGELFTGETYIKKQYGPVPANFEGLVGELKKEGYLEISAIKENFFHENDTQVYSLSKLPEDYKSKLSAKEIKMLDRIIKLYSGLTGKMLEEISHSQAPWNAVNFYEEIPYELSFYRDTNFEY